MEEEGEKREKKYRERDFDGDAKETKPLVG